jgi:hypothetical protein
VDRLCHYKKFVGRGLRQADAAGNQGRESRGATPAEKSVGAFVLKDQLRP